MKKENTFKAVSFGIAVTLILAGLVMAGPASQKPRGFSIGTGSTVIVPAMRPVSTDVWEANTAYTQGAYIRIPTNQNVVYWCVTAGTSGGTEPGWSKLDDVTDNSITWAIVDQSRCKLYIQNLGSGGTVHLGFDWPAVVNKGIGLAVSGGSFSLDREAYQGEVRAISNASTNVVTTQVLPN